jgi:hypothetical protein
MVMRPGNYNHVKKEGTTLTEPIGEEALKAWAQIGHKKTEIGNLTRKLKSLDSSIKKKKIAKKRLLDLAVSGVGSESEVMEKSKQLKAAKEVNQTFSAGRID